MKRRSLRVLCVSGLVLCLASSAPLEALCWGSLYVASRSSRLSARCPNPTLTKTWRVRCYDGCGHTDGNMTESLAGSGECFKSQNCLEGVKCLPLAGPEIVGFNPPSLSASIVNTEGYYASSPCSLPSCRSAGVSVMSVVCSCDPGWDPISCADNDPIIVSLSDRQYWLTDREGGVSFDLGNIGVPVQVPWTHPDSDEAFLVLDRNDNGAIDNGRELFGDITPQHVTDSPNGFLALALFDDSLSGGNEDGRISDADEIFPRLGLWRDANHNGISEPEELLTLTEVGLEWIDLDYRVSPRVDRHGNEFRYRSRSGWTSGGIRRIWNVFLVAP